MTGCATATTIFEPTIIEETWSKDWRLRYWLSPLEQACEELRHSGFLIEQLREPGAHARVTKLCPFA